MSLHNIQKNVKAGKGQYNSFGKYRYRSAEDILEAVKAEMTDDETLILCDDIVLIGDRYYVKATATFTEKDGKQFISTALAREALTKKGMDDSQITGAASSYARKYALQGLFILDDGADSDYLNTTKGYTEKDPDKELADLKSKVKSLINKKGSNEADMVAYFNGKYTENMKSVDDMELVMLRGAIEMLNKKPDVK